MQVRFKNMITTMNTMSVNGDNLINNEKMVSTPTSYLCKQVGKQIVERIIRTKTNQTNKVCKTIKI